MSRISDYAELPMNVDDLPEDVSLSLWVVLKDRTEMVFNNATSAIRYQGWWIIGHEWFGDKIASSMVENEKVMYFRVVESSRPPTPQYPEDD